MIEIDLFQQLRDYPGLNTLVRGRVYALVAPQGATLPYCTYSKVSNQKAYAKSGYTGNSRPRFQISCYAKTYLAAKQIAEQVTAALEEMSGTVRSAQQQNEVDLYEPDTGFYHVPVDFFLHIKEAM